MKYLLINFSPPFVSRFAQRSPRMANKAHVMQANADLAHDLTHNSQIHLTHKTIKRHEGKPKTTF